MNTVKSMFLVRVSPWVCELRTEKELKFHVHGIVDMPQPMPEVDPAPESHDEDGNNSCIEGSILGGIAGGGAGAAAITRRWSLVGNPFGYCQRCMVGCEIDGG